MKWNSIWLAIQDLKLKKSQLLLVEYTHLNLKTLEVIY